MRKYRFYSILCAIACACFMTAGCDFDGFNISFGNFKGEFVEEEDWTVDAAGLDAVDTATTHGSVIVKALDTDKITVHAVKTTRAKTDALAEELSKNVTLHVEPDNGTLRIYKKQPKIMKDYSVGVSYTIECPASLALKLASTHGKIDVTGIENAVDAQTTHGSISLVGGRGNVRLSTSHASVHVEGSEGPLDVVSSHGKITVRNVKADDRRICLRTSHAPIDIENCRGNIDAETSHGSIKGNALALDNPAKFSTSHSSITLDVRNGSAPIHAQTTHGSITMNLPGDFSGQLDAETSNGKIQTDFPVAVNKPFKERLKGPIGGGGDALLHLRASHGGINIRKNNIGQGE